MTEATRRGSGFGWAFATVFVTIPTVILMILASSFRADSSEWLVRLDRQQSGLPNGERYVTGEAQLASGRPPLTAPMSQRPCLAWEAGVNVNWTTKDSEDRDVSNTEEIRRSGASTRWVVVDERAGVLATVDVSRLELIAARDWREVPGIPSWAADFEKTGDDSLSGPHTYGAHEKVLLAGETVTFFAKGAERVAPLDGHERLIIFVGTPAAWREQLEGMQTAATWMLRVGGVLGFVAVCLAMMFLRAQIRLRRSNGKARSELGS
ncbi:MAG: hypothetical protein QM817_32420 [Archangium sp.]